MKRMTSWVSLATLLIGAAVMPARAGVLETMNDAGIHFNGFVEYDIGARTQEDPVEDDLSLHEIRLQLDGQWYHDLFSAQVKFDFVDDDLAMDQEDVDLEMGRGFFDLRQANVLISPLAWMDLKVGRQVLTWGTGDLVFINDLFPKDWQSFFLGRDVEYLKAPSDALFVSLFPPFANIDIAYTPRFDADRHITGERISYWNGQGVVGQDSVLNTDRPDDWFESDELAARIYRSFGAYEWAAYGYYGFWKSPGGMNPETGAWIFPALAVYGGSVRGPLGKGIMNVEAGYYDSLDDRDGDDPFVNNSEARALVGYEQELIKNFMVGVQYYFERMLDYCKYMDALEAIGQPTDTARDEDRHTLTLRLTSLLMNQNLVLSCFTRYSPSDHDIYIKPVATYKVSDRWKTSVGGNIFFGEDDHTFLGQFEDNNNVNASVRYSF